MIRMTRDELLARREAHFVGPRVSGRLHVRLPPPSQLCPAPGGQPTGPTVQDLLACHGGAVASQDGKKVGRSRD
jgi:hypothetical protein